MKNKDIMALAIIVIISIVISSILAGALFNKKNSASVPAVQSISSTFPDIKSDPNYKSIFNAQALDPTQLIQIGTSQNSTPFNGNQ